MGRLKEAIESTGGFQVWIKTPTLATLPPVRPDSPIEALATSEIYPSLLSAIQRQSEKDGLRFRLRETRGPDGWRTADLRLDRGSDRVCRWRVREVRHLLRAAIVIDDLGLDLQAARKLLALPYPLTLSVLPHLRYSSETAEEAYRARREVMLHLPMEPEAAHPSPGKGEIHTGMSSEELRQILELDLASVPHAAGVNNHMGSRATTQAVLMTRVMKALANHRLYFIDSRTTSGSVALDAARRQGLPAFYRSVFLDDTETIPYTLGQLREFRRAVQQQSVALAIGHPYPSTLAALANFLPELAKEDIQLVPASQLVQLPEIARLWPAHRSTP